VALLEVTDLKAHFATRRGTVYAVDGVSMAIEAGETVGLVGESGCGKSTLGKAIMRLIEPTFGTIALDEVDITHLTRRRLAGHRHKIQMIFQDPYASLNPRATVGRILEEPMIVNKWGSKSERVERVAWLLDKVGLPTDSVKRFPHEYSGGQRQRIGIARAIALRPKIVICDEAVSALDVSIRAQIINLMTDLRDELGLSYLFISHDLSTVEHIADRVAVMYLGKIVEIAESASLWTRPLHPYSQLLTSAVPVPDPKFSKGRKRDIPGGELPSPLNPPDGCKFHTRCPFVQSKCRTEEPPLLPVGATHTVACHFVDKQPDGTISTPSQAGNGDSNITGRSDR